MKHRVTSVKRPVITNVSHCPEGFFPVIEVMKHSTEADYSRALALAYRGVMPSIKLMRNSTDKQGQVFINPTTVKNMKNPANALFRLRMLAIRDKRAITPEMKFVPKKKGTQAAPVLFSASTQILDDVITKSVIEMEMPMATPAPIETSTEASSRAERLVGALESNVNLQRQILGSLERLERLWA